ncbi:Pentatricopeptide repeat-containing protein [Heracleum sosnowskyi]|uniref:Pentatricopeptide repeat-containing protein n=1 Tax=Heracleum sosnowskyi TaxID=360622 RepID=A0AAD8HB74_9APIA|nr:Pentatricopeptide repeat-containing protein [Heracleum sosnowskyi]
MLKFLTGISRHNKLLFPVHQILQLSTSIPAISRTYSFNSHVHETLHCFLEKCSSMKHLKLIHAQIILNGLSNQIVTLSKLISFCALSKDGDIVYAHQLFDNLPEPNRHMYNSLIRGYSNSDDPTKAVLIYQQMNYFGISPNEFTLPFVLKACAFKSLYVEGVLVHGQVLKLGFGSHVCVQNVLISFYFGCGMSDCSGRVFHEISDRTLVSWNSMIGGYSKMGCSKEAFLLFAEMRELGVKPDGFTFVSLLSVCSEKCDVELGKFVHWYIEINGVKTDIYVRNSLVDMYAKCGYLNTAQALFDKMEDRNVVSWTTMVTAYAKRGLTHSAKRFFDQMPLKNVVSWNSMISCYIQEGCFGEALELFFKMCDLKYVPDETTLVGVISACCQLGDLAVGKKIHDYIHNNKVLYGVTLYNALVDMYAKCGSVETALAIFLNMPEKNVVSWNVMIGALALHGDGYKAIELFERMEADSVLPDKITFTGLLSACCHCGLTDMGRYYFDKMTSVYKVPCDIEHYACMIDLLSRGGNFREAMELIGRMPMKPDIVIWGALLGGCRIHGNVEIAKQIVKHVLELETYSAGLYVLISNIYCEAQRWEDMKRIRKLMQQHGITKGSGISSIESTGFI